MRFEQENRLLKEYIKNTTNRINAPISICTKVQFQFGFLINTNFKALSIIILSGPQLKVNLENNAAIKELTKHVSSSLIFFRWIKINGLKFEKYCALDFGFENNPNLFTLEYCLMANNKNIYFIVNNSLNNLNFNHHYNCFEVTRSNINNSFHIFELNDLRSLPTTCIT